MSSIARLIAPFILAVVVSVPSHAQSLRDAVAQAVATNPLIGEAAANRRAIEQEIDQARGLYRPRLDLQAFTGPQKINRPESLGDNNWTWRNASQASLTASQRLFDGYFRAFELYRQHARVSGAAFRVLERSEVVALDAIEAYVDLLRHRRTLHLANVNIEQHRDIAARIADLAAEGTSTEGDVQQARERLAGAEAIRSDIIQAIGEVEARYKRVIGHAPGSLQKVGNPKSLPRSKEAAVAIARSNHPSLKALDSDIESAEAEVGQTQSLFLPKIDLEGTALIGKNLGGTPGRNDEVSARVALSWNLFDGGIRNAQKRETIERKTEVEIRRDRVRRDIDEAAERSFSDVHANNIRVRALNEQLRQAELVRGSYREEFDAGLRSLLDILDAQATVFNAQVQVTSAQSIGVFSRYQLIASTGRLLERFGINAPRESEIGVPASTFRPAGGFSLEPLRKW
ncbi:MAG: TolC family outer membrane protein [Pseudomonadota bacterium]